MDAEAEEEALLPEAAALPLVAAAAATEAPLAIHIHCVLVQLSQVDGYVLVLTGKVIRLSGAIALKLEDTRIGPVVLVRLANTDPVITRTKVIQGINLSLKNIVSAIFIVGLLSYCLWGKRGC